MPAYWLKKTVTESSISREIKRGKVERINSDLTKSYVYRWDVAQRNYEKNTREEAEDIPAYILLTHFFNLCNV